MNEYLDSLNAPQRAAVTSIDGPQLVIAGAGSGKTRVLTMRIAYLLQQGVKPYNILALTFTNKAAREMKERIAGIVGSDLSRQLWMGTFHSVFMRILKIEAEALGLSSDFTVYDTADSKSLLRSIIKDMQLDDKTYKLSNVLGAISQAKNDLVGPSAYAQNSDYVERDKAARRPRMAEIYVRYAAMCRKQNALDFDDLLFYMHILLRDNPDILAKYQQKFTHVLVDEYQDTNHAQYVIVKRLVDSHHNLCVVGDDAQSIYSFRGARIENILGLERDYPELKVFKLEQNYRSTQNIVNAANSLIEKNVGRLQKTVFSENDEGEPLRVCSAASDLEEAEMVVRDIAVRMRTEGLRPSDFVILYRTNAQSRAFEDVLRKHRVPYKVYGGLSFYQRKEIKDLLAYFRVAVNPKDSESLKRIINYPARGIGQTTIEKIIAASMTADATMWDAMQPSNIGRVGLSSAAQNKVERFVSTMDMFAMQSSSLNAYEFAAEVVSQSGIMKELNEDKDAVEGRERLENVNELLNSLHAYVEERHESGDDCSIRSYLEEVALITDMDSDTESAEQVRLMTIHSSKGLEFSCVYIVGVEDETFPGSQSGLDPKSLEEERRLFYVAITRAKKAATVSYCLSRFIYGQRTTCHQSRFLADINSEYICRPEAMNIDRPRSLFHVDQRQPSSFQNGRRTQSFQNPYSRNHTGFSGSYRASKTSSPMSRPQTAVEKAGSSFGTSPAGSYEVGQKVIHETFGRGVIMAIEGCEPNTKLRVKFDNLGEKLLLVRFARLKKE